MNLLIIFLIILAVRIASVFVVQTFYVPDEYWQSLEVAHKLTFGYGYLTWEWVQGLRSYLYPLAIAGIYKVLAIFQLDTVQLLIISPRIFQALLSAYSDYRFFIWCGKRKWALFLILVSWFWFYTGSRTLTNTLEASLTTIALSYFPWYGESTSYIWIAALCTFLRPTAAIIWIPLCVYHLSKSKKSAMNLIFSRFLVIGLLVCIIGITVDTYLYGKLIVTPYEFLKYNVFHNVGSFYGSHPWHWYITTGLPTVLGINSLPFLFGFMETVRNRDIYPMRKQLLITISLSLLALSVIEHKEFRFVTSLLPLCLYICADTLTRWSYKASKTLLWMTAAVILVGNAIPAWYVSTVHQKGPIDLMPKLQNIAQNYKDENQHRASILFLMPCHSTPYYSHIHENVTLRFLTCEPNLENKKNYLDEADQFYESPVHWLRSHIPSYPRTAMPTHVVLFEPLASKIHEFLVNYKIIHRIINAEVNDIVTAKLLLSEWWNAIKEKQLNVESLLQHIKSRTGKSILVYQRLRIGEENEFNRDDKQQEKPTKIPGSINEDIIHGTDEVYKENVQNLFN